MKRFFAPAKRPPRVDRLADSVAIVLTMTVVQRLIGFGRSALFLLWLSAEELGEWDITFGFLALAVPVAVLSLPGSFGRYIAHYRQRGQLRAYLRQMLMATLVLATTSGAVLAANRFWFSNFIFGRADRADLVLAIAFSLLAMVAYGTVGALLTALCMQRLASGLELFNTLVFALIAGVLLAGWEAGTLGVVLTYGAASSLSACVALLWIIPWWRSLPESEGPPSERPAVWMKILPFVAAMWLANGVANLFAVADRWILAHYSGEDAASSLAIVGEYHGSRIIPMLLVAVCELLGTVVTPFLSHEWEAGHQPRVAARLNLVLKLAGLALFAFSTAILFASPLFFDWMLHGKFQIAPAILPLVLVYCCWAALAALAKTYLWCAEKAMLVTAAYALALVASIGLNVVLVPRFGIDGAVAGMCVAQAALLLTVFVFGRVHGLVPHPATCLISTLPLLLAFGPWVSLAGVIVMGVVAVAGEALLHSNEKREIVAALDRYRALLSSTRTPRRNDAPGVTAPEGAAANVVGASSGQPHARRPLRIMFVHTSLFTGGAEMLLVDVVRGLDRGRFLPEICCLKERGPLAEQLPQDTPVFHSFIRHKYDFKVVLRLARLFRDRQVDVIVTVGAGDKMFWGRLAAWATRVPVIACWIHSTGWPDCIGRLNRMLTPITDAFIGVAGQHGRFLTEVEKFPADHVYVVENGVDIDRFRPRPADEKLRGELGLPATAPIVGIVARLAHEKNHDLFLRVASQVREQVSDAHFLLVGDGPERGRLQALARQLRLDDAVHFLGNRGDVPELLALLDVFALTSHVEANPLSVLEALSTGKPAVVTRVGSLSETVQHGENGYLVAPGDAAAMTAHLVELLRDPRLARRLGGEARRRVVEYHSMRGMIDRLQDLVEQLFSRKVSAPSNADPAAEVQLLAGTNGGAAMPETAALTQ